MPRYAAPNFAGAPLVEHVQQGSANAVGFTAGVTARPLKRLQAAVVYRQGAKLPLLNTAKQGGGTQSESGSFTIPTALSAGVSLSLGPALKVMADYSHLQYSAITRNFKTFAAFTNVSGEKANPQDFKVDDANEVHAGVEYVFINAPMPIAVRFGSWYDPDHAVRFDPPALAAGDPYDVATFRRGKNVVHGSAGAGVAVGHAEINVAADVSSTTRTVSISVVGRF